LGNGAGRYQFFIHLQIFLADTGGTMKRERAYVDGRRNQIMEILRRNSVTRVDALAKRLGVSVITVRRDLQYLEENNLVTRFYGGAKVADNSQNPLDEIRLYRELISRYAAALVEDDDTIFINTSSTALSIIQYVQKNNVTVITNNGKAIHHEKGQGVNVILTGGELRYPKEAMVGDFAIRNLQNIYAKKAFIGCSGISAQTGMTTENANEVNLNQLMIEHATQEVYVLADHTKIGRSSSFISCGIQVVQHLITDERAPQEELDLMREQGVKIHQVQKGEIL